MFKNIKNLFQKNNKELKKSSNSKNNKDNSSKKKLLKVITIISYILSFVFIIIMLVSCFKSCNSSDSSRSNNIPSISSKESKPILKQNNIIDLSGSTWTFNSEINLSSYGSINYYDINFTTSDVTCNLITFNSFRIDFYEDWDFDQDYGINVYNDTRTPKLNDTYKTITIIDGEYVTNSDLINFLYNSANHISGGTVSGGSGGSSESPSSSEIPSSIIPSNELVSSEYEYLDSIVFSNTFDWRILLTNGYQENTGLFYCDSDYFNQIIFSGLEFVSNDKLYNRIVLYPVGLDMATSVIYTEYTETGVKQVKSAPLTDLFGSTPTGKVLCGLMYVTYEYWDNGSSEYSDVIFSCYEINWAGDNSSNKTVYGVNYNVPRWSSNNYKRLDIISKSDTGANSHYYPNITLYDLLTVNSNVSVASYGSFVDVFSLFASAFGGMTSIFAISVLPNITLGALLFLPLVVVLFITIIRLIKK